MNVALLAQMSKVNWRSRARCGGSFKPEFFAANEETPLKERTPEEAAVIAKYCDPCPVAGNCLMWALANKEKGIWGGTTARERKKIARPGWRRKCVRCHNEDHVVDDEFQICRSCGLTWAL